MKRVAEFLARTARRPLPILVTLILLAGLVGCKGGGGDGGSGAADSTATAAADSSDGTDDADSADAAKKTEKAIKVDAGYVHRGDLVIPVFADGVLRTTRTVDVRSKLAGELVDVRVRDGDRVREGQLLARIDPREYRLSLEESRYRHIQALTQVAAEDEEQVDDPVAMKDFVTKRDALEQQHDRGKLNDEEFRARLLDLELDALKAGAFRQDAFAQRTGLADARIAEERARLNLEYTDIRAPFAGVVSGLTAVKGENATIGQTICTVSDNAHLEAVVNVLEADLGDLDEGRRALVAVPAVGDTIRGTVDVISPSLDQTTRTCQVIVRFENPDGRYRPGMFVRAEVAAQINHDRLLVPRDAVLTRDDRTMLFKVTDDGRAQWLYVDTGLQNSSWIEILKVHSGGSLASGDRVVVSNHLTLAHEAKLKIGKTIETTDRWAVASAGTTP